MSAYVAAQTVILAQRKGEIKKEEASNAIKSPSETRVTTPTSSVKSRFDVSQPSVSQGKHHVFLLRAPPQQMRR